MTERPNSVATLQYCREGNGMNFQGCETLTQDESYASFIPRALHYEKSHYIQIYVYMLWVHRKLILSGRLRSEHTISCDTLGTPE